MKRYLPFVIIVGVLGLAVGTAIWLFRSAQPQTVTTALPASSPAATPVPVTGDVAVIDEYGDYQCPPCGALHPILKQLKGEFGARLQINFHHFPLTQIHKHALAAASASVAAALQGRFEEMHNLLYENQKVWSEADNFQPLALNFARQARLDVGRFTQDLAGNAVRARIAADMQQALALKVDSTPTVFINGQQLANEKLTLENLRQEIGQRLKK